MHWGQLQLVGMITRRQAMSVVAHLKGRMKKSHFSNKTFYWLLLAIVGNMLVFNLYSTLSTGRLIGLLPITIQVILIGLIIVKHQYVKKGIEIWVVISFIIPYGMMLFCKLPQDQVCGIVEPQNQPELWDNEKEQMDGSADRGDAARA